LMVFATAFGTALFGFLIDIGFTVEGIACCIRHLYIYFFNLIIFGQK
jgi:hypothetical protein